MSLVVNKPSLEKTLFDFNSEAKLRKVWEILHEVQPADVSLTWNRCGQFTHRCYEGSVVIEKLAKELENRHHEKLDKNNTLPKNVRVLLYKVGEELDRLSRASHPLSENAGFFTILLFGCNMAPFLYTAIPSRLYPTSDFRRDFPGTPIPKADNCNGKFYHSVDEELIGCLAEQYERENGLEVTPREFIRRI